MPWIVRLDQGVVLNSAGAERPDDFAWKQMPVAISLVLQKNPVRYKHLEASLKKAEYRSTLDAILAMPG